MTGMESARSGERPQGWKKLAIAIFPLAALVAACLVFRTTNPPAKAVAQGPAKSAPKGSGGGVPRFMPGTPARPAATSNAPAKPAADGSKAPPAITTLKVVAVVNSEQITRQDLGRECLRRYGSEVLESLINKQLIAEACAKQGIQITEKDLTEEIDRIAAKFGLPRDRWLALLREERGFTEEQYRREVVWPMLALRRASAANVEVSQEDLKKAFESEYGPKVKCRLIIHGDRQKMQKIHAAVMAKPEDFPKWAKEGEDASVAAAHGVIPPIALHTGDPAIAAAAFKLQKGQVSPIITVRGNKYVILKCEDHLPEQFVSSKDLPAVQQNLADRLRDGKTRAAAANFYANVQSTAEIVSAFGPKPKQPLPAGVAALVNGRQITMQQLQDECLVRFGGDVLDGEINRKLFAQELARRKATVTEQDIQAEIARAAATYGYLTADRKPDVERWIKDVTTQDGATVDLYKSDVVWPTCVLKKLCEGKVKITQEELQKGFESNYGERVKVLAIVVSDQRQANRVWEMARNNPTDAYFASLAQQYSVEPSSRANGGEVPPICKHSGSPAIEKEAFKLEAGELSGIIAIEDQFIILRCQGRTDPVQKDFSAVKDEIYQDIHEKKLRAAMNAEFERIRERAQIDNFVAGTSQSGNRAAGPANGPSVVPAIGPQGSVAPASATAPRTGGSVKR